MTWIATCNGERGIHQETIMTDEERQKLCERLSSPWTATDDDCTMAADEIERLYADKLNAGYQRDQALIELNRLTERVDQLEAQVTALSRM